MKGMQWVLCKEVHSIRLVLMVVDVSFHVSLCRKGKKVHLLYEFALIESTFQYTNRLTNRF